MHGKSQISTRVEFEAMNYVQHWGKCLTELNMEILNRNSERERKQVSPQIFFTMKILLSITCLLNHINNFRCKIQNPEWRKLTDSFITFLGWVKTLVFFSPQRALGKKHNSETLVKPHNTEENRVWSHASWQQFSFTETGIMKLKRWFSQYRHVIILPMSTSRRVL